VILPGFLSRPIFKKNESTNSEMFVYQWGDDLEFEEFLKTYENALILGLLEV
jgi:hypothetical protein